MPSLMKRPMSLLPFLHGQVEGDGSGHSLAVLEVPEEPDGDVETGDDDHGGVEDAVPAPEGLGLGHLVLQGEHDADALKSVDGSAKIQRKLRPGLWYKKVM